ncbi:hypothetical protein BCR44DRAFT_60390 [Catenaria anguillulae PL171]|uniref:Uncharacterized protein n=1 Tax=Catenaria anguillulae PL171 TaxID=765915 RepID=A0A1Y2HHN5_9FUNG|nr:hypothetical protein BCR44DRAFT_60390 [Catenaria anguillulae PL171]
MTASNANVNDEPKLGSPTTTPSPYHYAIAILLSLYCPTALPATPLATTAPPPSLDPILHLIVPLSPPVDDPFDPTYPQLLGAIRSLFAPAITPASAAQLADQLDAHLAMLVSRGPASLVSSLTPLLDRLHSHSYLYSWIRNFLTRIHMCEFVVVDLHAALIHYMHPTQADSPIRFMSLETARAWVENATKLLQSSLAPTPNPTSTVTASPPPPSTLTLSHIHSGTLHVLARYPDQAPAHYLASLIATLHGRATHALDHLTHCEALTRSTADVASPTSTKPDSLLHQKCWRALTRALVYLKLDWTRAALECLHVALDEANFALDSECAAVATAHLRYLQANEADSSTSGNGRSDVAVGGTLGNVSDAVARLGAGVFELHAVLVLVREALANAGPRDALAVLDHHVHGVALVPADQRLVDLERTCVHLHEAFLACDWERFDAIADALEERARGISEQRGACKQLHRLALMRGHAAIRRSNEAMAIQCVELLGETLEAQCIRIMAYLAAQAWGLAFDLVAFYHPPPRSSRPSDPWSLLYSILQHLVRSHFRTTTISPSPMQAAAPTESDPSLDLTSLLAAIGQLAPASWIRALVLGQVFVSYPQLAETGVNKDGRFTHGDVFDMAWEAARAVNDRYWLITLITDTEWHARLVGAGFAGELQEVERVRQEAARAVLVTRPVF